MYQTHKGLPYTRPRLLSYFARKLVHGFVCLFLYCCLTARVWAVALLENKQNKAKKVTVPVYVAPTWRLDRSSDPNLVTSLT